MGMNANVIARNGLHYFSHDLLNFIGLRTAVRVAKNDPARAFFISGLGASQRIFWIGLVTVKEVLAVEQNLPALRPRGADALSNRCEVLLVGGLQSDLDVIVPRLSHKANGIGLRIKQRSKARIVGRRTPRPPSHAEGSENCI